MNCPTTAEQLLRECITKDVRLRVSDGSILIDANRNALTSGLLQRLSESKSELLVLLRDRDAHDQASGLPPIEFDDTSAEVIDPPLPCAACGSLELWQSLTGAWRCLRCEPPTAAWRLRGFKVPAARATNDNHDNKDIDC